MNKKLIITFIEKYCKVKYISEQYYILQVVLKNFLHLLTLLYYFFIAD